MTFNGVEGHSPIASLFNWYFSSRLQVAPPGERYGGNRRPGRKQRQTTAE